MSHLHAEEKQEAFVVLSKIIVMIKQRHKLKGWGLKLTRYQLSVNFKFLVYIIKLLVFTFTQKFN